MGSKKRALCSAEEVELAGETQKETQTKDSNASKPVEEPEKQNLKPMERRKKRKALDKDRHHNDPKTNSEVSKPSEVPGVKEAPLLSSSSSSSKSSLPAFHIHVFRDLASAVSSVRKEAAETLAVELIEVQRAYEKIGGEEGVKVEGAVQLEAEKDDGLENCAASLRYAIRRLIRGVSSSREVMLCSTFLLFFADFVVLWNEN